jgi:hypothetical protein
MNAKKQYYEPDNRARNPINLSRCSVQDQPTHVTIR